MPPASWSGAVDSGSHTLAWGTQRPFLSFIMSPDPMYWPAQCQHMAEGEFMAGMRDKLTSHRSQMTTPLPHQASSYSGTAPPELAPHCAPSLGNKHLLLCLPEKFSFIVLRDLGGPNCIWVNVRFSPKNGYTAQEPLFLLYVMAPPANLADSLH